MVHEIEKLPDGGERWICKNGKIIYYNEKGQKHRTDGPAVIRSDGEEWWVNGECHY